MWNYGVYEPDRKYDVEVSVAPECKVRMVYPGDEDNIFLTKQELITIIKGLRGALKTALDAIPKEQVSVVAFVHDVLCETDTRLYYSEVGGDKK